MGLTRRRARPARRRRWRWSTRRCRARLGAVHWPMIGRLLPHALVAAEAAERFRVGFATAGAILNEVAVYHHARAGLGRGRAAPPARARHPRAEPRPRAPRPRHNRSTTLAWLYQATPAATPRPSRCYRRALAIRERRPSAPSIPDLANSLDNLAWLYQVTGRYAEAEPLLERALAIREAEPRARASRPRPLAQQPRPALPPQPAATPRPSRSSSARSPSASRPSAPSTPSPSLDSLGRLYRARAATRGRAGSSAMGKKCADPLKSRLRYCPHLARA